MSVTGADIVIAHLNKWAQERQTLANLAMTDVIAALEGWAQAEAPAGAAIAIHAEVASASAQLVSGVLSANVDFAALAKLAGDGDWAFLWPIIVKHEAEIVAMVARRMAGGE